MKPSGAHGSCSKQRGARIDLRIRLTSMPDAATAL
jgi:hypothetical protein